MSSEEEVNIPTSRKRKRISKNVNSKIVKIDADNAKLMDVLSTHFHRDEAKDAIFCSVADCNSTVARWQLYFFKRHFEMKHPTLLKELFPDAFTLEKKCRIALCELTYNAAELVTINGFPFSILSASAIKGFLKKQIEELNANGFKITINRKMIVQKIREISDLIRKRITSELKNKMLSIMFDICTKRTFSVLGISVTFMENDVVIARSLGTVHLTERHRGPYLSSVVEDTLQQFGVKLRQIISGTADQASNMNNTTRHLVIRANNEIEGDDDDLSGDELADETFEQLSENDDEIQMELENQIELQNELNNEDQYIDLVTNMAKDLLRKNSLLSSIPKIHCCAHTCQLAVKEAINKSNALPLIEAAREMMKLLRTTVVNVKFRKLAPDCILPRQYIDIRWNSDYQMVIFLILIWLNFLFIDLFFIITA